MAEDFSKETLSVRSELVNKAKVLKQTHEYIKGFKINYRRLVLKYENPDNHNIFYRSFSLADIHSSSNWYVPTKRNDA